jgi:hypothetical protein
MIKAVVISKTESCLSYALKRIGADDLLPIDYDRMVSGEHFHVLRWSETADMQAGDLVLWNRDLARSLLPIEITTAGTIVHGYLPTGLHYAVYEGDGILSDSTRDGDYPVVRLRKLADCRPDWILRRRGDAAR